MFKRMLDFLANQYPSVSLRAMARKINFVLKYIKYHKDLLLFEKRMGVLNCNLSCEQQSNMFGLIEWPYINNSWGVATRLDVFATHYEILHNNALWLKIIDKKNDLLIVDLSFAIEGVYLLIDQANWFLREGELVLNLFKDDLRVSSLAFTIGKERNELIIFIGAIQGIHKGVSSEESLFIFKQISKACYGLRPRSILIEVLRMIGSNLGVVKIMGVSDEHRHHRHPYFGKRDVLKYGANYNEIWKEHGGEIDYSRLGFYDIPIVPERKKITDIPSRKRALYRHRNELLNAIKDMVESKCTALDN